MTIEEYDIIVEIGEYDIRLLAVTIEEYGGGYYSDTIVRRVGYGGYSPEYNRSWKG